MISKVYKRIFGFALYVECYKHPFPHYTHPPPPPIPIGVLRGDHASPS